MRTDLPQSIIEEAMKLEAKGLVHLYKLDFRPPDGSVLSRFICPMNQVTWQGRTWFDDTPCAISESSLSAAGETSRPKFSIVNPNGVFSRYVHQKYVDNAIINRYRVLTTDLAADYNSYILHSWRVSKVLSLAPNLVVCELRSALDGQSFKIPGRTFRPPLFPTVSIR